MICSSRASCEHGDSHRPSFWGEGGGKDTALECYDYSSMVSALRGFLVLYREVQSKEVAGPGNSAAPCMGLNVWKKNRQPPTFPLLD